MGFVNTNTKGFTAGAALARFLRVKLSSGKLAAAGIADGPGVELGQIESESFADGDVREVRLVSANGTSKMVAAAAIAKGAKVFSAAAGKVSVSASTAFLLGVAMEAAAADGDIIEVLRCTGGDTAVT